MKYFLHSDRGSTGFPIFTSKFKFVRMKKKIVELSGIYFPAFEKCGKNHFCEYVQF